MATLITESNGIEEDGLHAEENGDVSGMSSTNIEEENINVLEYGAVKPLVGPSPEEDHLERIDASFLFKDQHRAYDIIDWHFNETLTGCNPPQLLMIIPGEGGVSKSKTIQTITENFAHRAAADLLSKSAYTGIAASLINGKTIHMMAQISVNGRDRSQKATNKLTIFWQNRLYLIIDEKSMISCKLLARISSALSEAKSLTGSVGSDLPFGGVNMILVGDFHQFPPVTGRPLYWPVDPKKADAEDFLGRSLYEQFKTVVCLKQQVHVVDEDWLDLLHHVCNGSCRAQHLEMLRSLIITNPKCPRTDFTDPPWNQAVLITP